MLARNRVVRLIHSVVLNLLCILVIGSLGGCDFLDMRSAESRLQKAKSFEEQGKLVSAMIELKDAVRKYPDDGSLRLLLGKVYVELGDGLAGEEELRRAKDRGISDVSITVPMTKAFLLQRKFKEALDSASGATGLSADEMAELHEVKARTFIAQGDLKRAEEELKTVATILPDSPRAWFGYALIAYYKRQWEEALKWTDKILASDPKSVKAWVMKGDIGLARGDSKSAETAYATALKSRPENAAHRLGLAIAQINNGKLDEAARHLDVVLKAFSQDPTANYYRAVVDYQLKRYDAAKIRAEKILTDYAPGDLRSLLLAAAASYAMGRLEEANAFIRQFRAAAPDFELGRKLQAAIQVNMGNAVEAAKQLEGVSIVSKNDAKLVQAVGFAAIDQGEKGLGLELLKRNADAHPNDPMARMQVGFARATTGDFESGISEFEKALKMKPDLAFAEASIALGYLRAGDPEKALEAALRMQSSHPNNPDGFTLAGLAYMGKKQASQAKASFEKALSVRPGDSNASHNLAVLALAEGKTNDARAILEAVLKKYPGDVSSTLLLVDVALRMGQVDEATDRLQGALKNAPGELTLRLALGKIYLAQRKPALALALAEEAVRRQQTDASILEMQGTAQLRLGRPQLAVPPLERAVKAAPNAVSSRIQLALAYEQLGNVKRAAEEMDTVAKLAPNDAPSKYLRIRLLAKNGKVEEAQALLAKLAASYPSDPSVVELKGDLALARNKPREAVDLYKAALASNQTNFLTVRLAAAQFRVGDRDGGFKTLGDWVNRYPDDTYTRGVLADALLGAGRFVEAGTHYEILVKNYPGSVAAVNNAALAALGAGDQEKALVYARQAYKLAPEQAQVLDTFGLVLMKNGNAVEAVEKLRSAVSRSPKDLQVRLHLGQALAAANHKEEAKQILNDLVATRASFPQKGEAQAALNALK